MSKRIAGASPVNKKTSKKKSANRKTNVVDIEIALGSNDFKIMPPDDGYLIGDGFFEIPFPHDDMMDALTYAVDAKITGFDPVIAECTNCGTQTRESALIEYSRFEYLSHRSSYYSGGLPSKEGFAKIEQDLEKGYKVTIRCNICGSETVLGKVGERNGQRLLQGPGLSTEASDVPLQGQKLLKERSTTTKG